MTSLWFRLKDGTERSGAYEGAFLLERIYHILQDPNVEQWALGGKPQ